MPIASPAPSRDAGDSAQWTVVTPSAGIRRPPESTLRRPSPRRPRAVPVVLVSAAIAAVYFVAGKLGLSVALVHPNASPVWAPTGIALAVLVGLGYWAWPGVFVGAFLVNLTTAGTFWTSLGIAGGNTLEALVGAYLVNRFASGRNAFDRAQDTLRFAILAGILSTTISATLGVTSLALAGLAPWERYGSIWLTWWLGDMGGALIIAPLLLLWIGSPPLRWTRAQAIEAIFLSAGLVTVGWLVFGSFHPGDTFDHPLAFLCIPFLVWAAIRFDQRAVSLATFLLAAVAVLETLAGRREPQLVLNESLVILQVFMAIVALMALTHAAVVAERRRAEASTRATSERLREAMTELETFSHSITHDLRSPVGAVLNYVAVLEDTAGERLGHEGGRLLGRVRASAESAADLLDQLVLLGRVELERDARQEIDMTALVQGVISEISAQSGEADLVSFQVGDLAPAWGNTALLRCALRNLLANSVKFTRGVTDRAVRVDSSEEDSSVTYCVTDNGIGFDPEHADTLFQPHLRHRAPSRFEGSGLGLAIVAKIVRKHRGRVWAESDGRNGARFCLTLPRRRNDA